jgi:hypothetical protein
MMQLEDLEYIFKPQIDEGTDKLYFTLIDGEHKVIERHPADDLIGLLPMLANFQYHDTVGRFPRFSK